MMLSDKITLDRETFKVLAADTRIEILKRLERHKETLSDIAEGMGLSPSTIKEHLDRLSSAGLIEQAPGETKWKYYLLTGKGRKILKPYETRVWILLATSLVFLMASVYTLVGVESGPAFMAQPADGDGSFDAAQAREAGIPAEKTLAAEDKKAPASEAPPFTAPPRPRIPYLKLSLVVVFAVLSGALFARAMKA